MVFHPRRWLPGTELRAARRSKTGIATFSIAVDLIRRGETVLTLIDPAARGRDPDAFTQWLSARLMIAELPRLIAPRLRRPLRRSRPRSRRASSFSATIALDETEPRGADVVGRLERDARAAASIQRHLVRGRARHAAHAEPSDGSRPGRGLRRIASTDPLLGRVRRRTALETLFTIDDGPLRGRLARCGQLRPSAAPSRRSRACWSRRTIRRLARSRRSPSVCLPPAGPPSSAAFRSRNSARQARLRLATRARDLAPRPCRCRRLAAPSCVDGLRREGRHGRIGARDRARRG